MGIFSELDVKYHVTEYNESITPEGHKEVCQKATEAGFEVIEGKKDLILLDIDSWEALCRYNHMQSMLETFFGGREVDRWESKSGKGYHITIKINPSLSAVERIALQACLGSDPKKEMFSLLRKLNGVKEPTVLFKPPGAKKA